MATLCLAVLVLGVGLSRFGIWQPAELRVADLARGETVRDGVARPPAQVALVRAGFRMLGPTETGGRLPTALLAIAATMALALAVGSASDARTGAFVGIAYATMPLVFMNARQMFGGGVAQSAFTLFFAAGLYVLWGRPPPGAEERGGALLALWRYGRWALLAALPLAVAGAGWMLGAAPVLLGLGIAALLRFGDESRAGRVAGVVLAAAGLVVTAVCLRAAVTPHEAYSALTGVGGGLEPPRQLPTYDAYIEQVGHALFPWTGIVAFGAVRLLFPPPAAGLAVGTSSAEADPGAAWREAGVRLGAFVTASVAFGLQSFHLQQFGMSPFIAAAPLAIAAGVALRDAEREAQPWRLVTAGAAFFTVIVMRDYLLFPKSSYAALGLPEGGPAFPTGFTGTLKDWFKAHSRDFPLEVLGGRAPGEIYFVVEAVLFILLGLSALFQGAGTVRPFAWSRPFTWLRDVEHDARAQLAADPPEFPARLRWARHLTGFGVLANLRAWLVGIAGAIAAVFGLSAALVPTLTTPVRTGFTAVALLPLIVVLATYAVLALWNLFAWLGDPHGPLMRLFGTRVAFVPLAALLTAVVSTQLFIPALSEHLSPRGVWAVIRQVRRPGEPVARYGGQQNDRATRYYANFEVRDVATEFEAVEWLTARTPRHYMIVGADVFPSLNRAYRRALPLERRRNVPVIDASNSNLYVAASDPGERGSRNPLDPYVLSVDTNNTGRLWHPHGRVVNGQFVAEPARFNDAIEYLGFNLDSNNQSFVPVGGSFTLTMHFRVLREVAGDHQIFIHVDGPCPRINGDHPPVGGRYPVRYWLAGDFIHDEHRMTIPGYCRAGRYFVYMGFFQGDDRMRVQGGDHDRENRVVAARINVR